jgi:hypothetical protein
MFLSNKKARRSGPAVLQLSDLAYCIWLFASRTLRRQHPSQNNSYHFDPVLAGSTLQRVSAFKAIRPSNLHLPAVIRLRTHYRDLPLARIFGKDVLDNRYHFRADRGIARILHLDRSRHTANSLPQSPASAEQCRERHFPGCLARIR